MSLILGVIVFLYVFLLMFLVYGFGRSPEYIGEPQPFKSFFSVVVPFRNEEKQLPSLLQSLSRLQYPLSRYEIIFVNDFSQDNSKKVCERFKSMFPQLSVHIMDNDKISGSPKKAALSKAIAAAKGQYIVTTDADCIVPENWLEEMNSKLVESEANLVAGPISLQPGKKCLPIFQEIDMFSLQTATMGSFSLDLPFMCNGANLCYEKSSFFKVNGFEGNQNIASGDDLFLLQKFRANGLKTVFLKSRKAVVLTSSQTDLKSLVSQRIRWASKTTAYKSSIGKLTGAMVLLMNLMILLSFFAYVMNWLSLSHFLFAFLIKFNVDFFVIFLSARFFGREEVMRYYLWTALAYPFFCTYVALASFFQDFEWKGRRFSK